MKEHFKKFIISLMSRRMLLYFINKFVAFYMYYYIKEEVYQLIIFGLSSIYDLFILQELNVKPIDAKIDVSLSK